MTKEIVLLVNTLVMYPETSLHTNVIDKTLDPCLYSLEGYTMTDFLSYNKKSTTSPDCSNHNSDSQTDNRH